MNKDSPMQAYGIISSKKNCKNLSVNWKVLSHLPGWSRVTKYYSSLRSSNYKYSRPHLAHLRQRYGFQSLQDLYTIWDIFHTLKYFKLSREAPSFRFSPERKQNSLLPELAHTVKAPVLLGAFTVWAISQDWTGYLRLTMAALYQLS